MELKMGKCKGMTVEQVLAQSGGDKILAGHLAFVEKGFGDPKWGHKNKEYYNAIKGEWSRLTASAPKTHVQQSSVEVIAGPSVSTKLDLLNIQIKKGFEEVIKRLTAAEAELSRLNLQLKEKIEIVQDVSDVVNPKDIAWEE